MPALSEHKLDIVRTLVETAPDTVVNSLQGALASVGAETPLGSVRRLVESEARDRQLRNTVLLPIVPMCSGAIRDPGDLAFPTRVLGLLWRGLKAEAPAVVRAAQLALFDHRPGVTSAEHFDQLAAIAAQGVRAREVREFRLAAEACDSARPGGGEALAACLDLAAVVRSVAHKLADWVAHPTEDAMIGSRLAYKDAVAIAPDAGPRFFRMLGAQLPHDWMVLRLISAIMDRPTERYLAESELGVFAERMLSEIGDALTTIQKFDLDLGPAAAVQAARLVDKITIEANEFENLVSLSRDQGWGYTVTAHRKALAAVVEGRLRECEKYFQQALPSGAARLKRIRRTIPRLSNPPDMGRVSRCQTLLTFVSEIRHSANYGGFAAARARLLEKLGEQLDHYVEEVLDMVKTGESDDAENARAFLAITADFARLIRDDKAAELVCRRSVSAFAAAAALDPAPSLAAGT